MERTLTDTFEGMRYRRRIDEILQESVVFAGPAS
jgi:hypothetical protein